MIKCPFCGVTSVKNTIFCGECGHYLLEDEHRGTDPLDFEEASKLVGPASDIMDTRPGSKISEPWGVRLTIGNRRREIEVSLDRIIFLGRVDPSSDVFPDVDLTEHGPGKNISRRHASIQKREGRITIEDMGSVNGTYVNGNRLEPYLPVTLRNGDILHLGRLRVEVEVVLE